MRWPVPSLVLLSLLTFGSGLGWQAITDADEAYYAEASREMVEGGDWLTPHFNYEDRWQKPVLYYWLTASAYLVAGPGEATARLWSALSGVALVLVTWAAARHAGGRAAWLAGAIVATCFGYFAMARSALPDLPLTCCITATIWLALRAAERDTARPMAWWVASGTAAGLGFLMKGPVAFLIPALVVVPIWWRERASVRLPFTGLAAAITAAVVVGVPWYVAMTAQHGTAYLQSFFVGDNLERFTTERFNESRPFWYYLPILIGGLLPWSAFALVLAVPTAVSFATRRVALAAHEWRLLIWAGVPLLFYSASVGQQPRYILPVLPPVAMALAAGITRRIDDGRTRTLTIAGLLSAVLFGVCGVAVWRLQPLLLVAPLTAGAAMIVLAAAAAAISGLVVARAWSRLPFVMPVCAAAVLLAVHFGALVNQRPVAVEQMASLVRLHRAHERVGPYQVFVRNLVFYTGIRQEDLFEEARAVEFLRSPDRVLLVVRQQDLARLEAAAGIPLERLGSVEYVNTANIRLGTLLAPQDAEARAAVRDTVLLVSNRPR